MAYIFLFWVHKQTIVQCNNRYHKLSWTLHAVLFEHFCVDFTSSNMKVMSVFQKGHSAHQWWLTFHIPCSCPDLHGWLQSKTSILTHTWSMLLFQKSIFLDALFIKNRPIWASSPSFPPPYGPCSFPLCHPPLLVAAVAVFGFGRGPLG